MMIPGRDVSWRQFARDLTREIADDDVSDYAASVAFSAFLAIFPFLLFAVALAGLVIDPATLDTLVAQIRRVAPQAVAQILTDRLHALTAGAAPGLLTFGAVGAIWASSSAVASLIAALNAACDVVSDRRPWWKRRALSLVVTLAGAVLFILASVITIAAPAVARAVGGPGGTIILWLRLPAAAVIMQTVIAGLYAYLPDVDRPFRFITPGSAFAVIAWILASLGFSTYVGHFARYEVVYGALGGVIVLLLWLWISALVILVGAEIDAVLDKDAPGSAPAPTPEPPAAPPDP